MLPFLVRHFFRFVSILVANKESSKYYFWLISIARFGSNRYGKENISLKANVRRLSMNLFVL